MSPSQPVQLKSGSTAAVPGGEASIGVNSP